MRQRIGPSKGATPKRHSQRQSSTSDGSTSWEIASDHGDDQIASPQPVPMFHPLHHSTSNVPPPPPGSVPVSWKKYHDFSGSFSAAPSSLQQLPSLTPAIIPDASYQNYLLGRPLTRRPKVWKLDKIWLAKLVAKFSWLGVGFLLWVGILIDTQPLFLPGILPKYVEQTGESRKQRIFHSTSTDERLPQASHAYQAAFMYFLTGCFCHAYAYNLHWYLHTKFFRQYRDIPDTLSEVDSTAPILHDYRDGDLPATANPEMRAYQYNQSGLREIATMAMNRLRVFLASIWPKYKERRRARRRYAGPKDV